jgi:polyphosphate kinase 2 (PPK2 family)
VLLKPGKLTPDDWRNRRRNRDYDEATEDLFERTNHDLAPWDLVAAENKRFARVRVLETVISRIEEGMRRWGTPVPEPAELEKLGTAIES